MEREVLRLSKKEISHHQAHEKIPHNFPRIYFQEKKEEQKKRRNDPSYNAKRKGELVRILRETGKLWARKYACLPACMPVCPLC